MPAHAVEASASTTSVAPQVCRQAAAPRQHTCPAAYYLADCDVTAVQPEQLQTGRFHYKDGTTYEGQYKMIGLPPPTPAEPVKKGAKKKEEEPSAQPAEPPKPVRHGTGTLKSGDYTYTGEWVDDEMHGQGRFVFASGACYEGTWEHNKYQGQGKYTLPDGKAYQGDWVSNIMHGQGSFTDTEEHCWAGQFYNGAGPGLTCQL